MRIKDYIFNNKIIKKIVSFCPADKNTMYFENFRGKGFGDDPRYIAEELHRRNPKYKMYWLTEDKNIKLPSYLISVKRNTTRAYYALAKSSVWVSNIKNSYKPRKKSNQFYVQCWHTTLDIKKNEASAKKLEADYIAAAKYDASITDLMYSDNDISYTNYKNNFWYSGEIIRCGVPRVGATIKKAAEFSEKIRNEYGISGEKKIAVYMPTFRSGRKTDVYNIDFEKVISALNERFSAQFVLLMKLHPSMSHLSFEITENAIDVTAHTDPYELLGAADVVISDYSGVVFDTVAADKPLFLAAKDFEEYKTQDRGFSIEYDRLPSKPCMTDEELIECIKTFNEEEYLKKCREFKNFAGFEDDLSGEVTIADIIEDFLKKQ